MVDGTVLITGAGPVGIAAALFLARKGVRSRVIDPKPEPTRTSNALGVNPRTLELLEPTGVTARILQEGFILSRLVVHQRGRKLGEVEIAPQKNLRARFPMVILPQSRTEALLAEALAEVGVRPERGVELVGLEQDDAGVTARLRRDGQEETVRAAVLFAADGAHSTVRRTLGIDFPGSSFPETWRVADVTVDAQGPPYGYIDFRPEGPWLALPYSAEHWRLIGFGSDLVSRLPTGWTLREVNWTSEFHIAHRLAAEMNRGRVCLAGDAAHVHAPVGARGMNLGIEDAFVFAECAQGFLSGQAGRLADYGRVRHKTDKAVVNRVKMITKAANATGPVAEAVRPFALPLVTMLPSLMHLLERTATGLDHEVRLS